MEENKL